MTWLRATTIALAMAAAGFAAPSPAAAGGTTSFQLNGVRYYLAAWDYGAAFRCRAGSHVGVLLLGPQGPVWSFAPYGDLAKLQARRGCGTGTVVSQVAGLAVQGAAHFAVTVRSCAGDCSGYEFFAFAFNGSQAYEELGQTLGEGGWSFKFPALVLYVNDGSHECPSRWTRMSYRWTDAYTSKYVLQRSVTYTSRQCSPAAPKKWPPDPGE